MRLWDWFCIASVVGIWPRWIEPNLLRRRRYTLPFPIEKRIKIAHLSDLHFANCSRSHLDQIVGAVEAMEPDLILFTGDFLCFGQLDEPEPLSRFLSRLCAPLGCFASPGNHDYAAYASRTEEGLFEIDQPRGSAVKEALKLLRQRPPSGQPTVGSSARQTPLHPQLVELLGSSPFQMLNNQSIELPGLNLVGLGDLWMGQMEIDRAYSSCNPDLPTLTLSHNPESYEQLRHLPTQLILSGHTHGAQIHLPWIGMRLAALSDPKYRRGWVDGRLYISSGLGAAEPFRLFSPPEVAQITLIPEEKS